MTNSYLDIKVDYRSILKSLEQVTNWRWEQWGRQVETEPATVIAEYRTIGLSVGRQCGITKAMVDWIVQAGDNQCVIIHKDRDISRWFKSYFQTNDSRYISLTANALRESIECKEGVMDNVGYHVQSAKPKYIIVDDSSIVFSYFGIKRKDFNDWVNRVAGPEVLVIHIK